MRCLLDAGAKEKALEAYEKEAEASRQEIRQLRHDVGMAVEMIAMLTDNHEVLHSKYDAIAPMPEQSLLDTDAAAATQEESKILINIEVLAPREDVEMRPLANKAAALVRGVHGAVNSVQQLQRHVNLSLEIADDSISFLVSAPACTVRAF